MTVVAVTMVRDEADVIPHTLAHMLGQVDHVLVADNLSTDGTRAILDELARLWPDRVTVVDDPDPAHRQSAKMTALALRARLELGAEWIVPFDADEVWYSPHGRLADLLDEVEGRQWLTVAADLYDHVTTDLDDPDELDPIARIGWRKVEPAPLPKIACRWRQDLVIEDGNHGARYRGGATVVPFRFVIRHFPCRSAEQFVRKVRNGSASLRAAGDELPETTGAHWRQWGAILEAHGEEAVVEIYRTWYHRPDPRARTVVADEVLPTLIYDPAPR